MERSKPRRRATAPPGLGRRLAGAPISWGVCEVPGWGFQLEPLRVLTELRELGLAATELGPPGFLPKDPARLRSLLAGHGLRLVAAFVAVVLHDPARRAAALATVREAARHLAAAGGEVLVLAAATGLGGYERGNDLDERAWQSLLETAGEAEGIAREQGLVAALHPHQGTVVEGAAQVARLLDSSRVPLCLDVGHLAVGGADPLEVARRARGRVVHVHLKDVNAALARRVRAGGLGYRDAVKAGLYTALGSGSARIGEIVRLLEDGGYAGWYVLEQDLVLDEAPAPGAGPFENALRSLEFLRNLAA
ncbi:MAG TPA: sugar phosphate isomerase/epimerase [Vicinamibacteria bacterium]